VSPEREAGGEPKRPRSAAGLCPECTHVERIVSGKGSTFLRCALQRADARFPKYPPQPVLSCPGFKR
jgi:hypothetical protein